MDCGTSLVGQSSISTHALNTQILYPPSLPQNMWPCSAMVCHVPCPCKGYAGTNKSICDACSHSFRQHPRPPAAPSPSQSSIAGSAPGRTKSVTSLFNHLLKSTPGGAAALQETSNGLRKKHSVSIPTPNLSVW